jgi:hypothetical protein
VHARACCDNRRVSGDGVRPPAAGVRLRRWPALVAAAAVGAVVAGAVSALITAQAVGGPAAGNAAQTVTVTADAPSPQARTGMPTADADRQTCDAWHSVDPMLAAAAAAQAVIPKGMTIADPAVRDTPVWAAGVARAGELYGQAADAMGAHVAAGGGPVLQRLADVTVSALRTLAISYRTYDPANGSSVKAFRVNKDAMDGFCP